MYIGTMALCAMAFGVGLVIIYGLICVALRAFKEMTRPEGEREFLLPSEEKAREKAHLN